MAETSSSAVSAKGTELLNEQTGILGTIGKEAKYIEKETDAKISATTARQNFANVVGKIVGAFLAGLGVIFLAYMVYSGFQWMTAGGEEEKITKARTRIINASIGLAIVALSYGVTATILTALNYNSQPTTNNQQPTTNFKECSVNGFIEYKNNKSVTIKCVGKNDCSGGLMYQEPTGTPYCNEKKSGDVCCVNFK